MTALAQRIEETPMAPYVGLICGMSLEEQQIVVTFITELMKEPKPKRQRQVPAEFKRLRGMVNISAEEIAQDEHLAHIMERGKDYSLIHKRYTKGTVPFVYDIPHFTSADFVKQIDDLIMGLSPLGVTTYIRNNVEPLKPQMPMGGRKK